MWVFLRTSVSVRILKLRTIKQITKGKITSIFNHMESKNMHTSKKHKLNIKKKNQRVIGINRYRD